MARVLIRKVGSFTLIERGERGERGEKVAAISASMSVGERR